MGIMIEFKDFEEMKAFARERLGATDQKEAAAPRPTTVELQPEPVQQPAAPSPVAEPLPKTVDPSEKQYTVEEVRAFLAGKTKAGKRAEVQAILKEMGGGKLSSVDPARYGELMEKAEAL